MPKLTGDLSQMAMAEPEPVLQGFSTRLRFTVEKPSIALTVTSIGDIESLSEFAATVIREYNRRAD